MGTPTTLRSAHGRSTSGSASLSKFKSSAALVLLLSSIALLLTAIHHFAIGADAAGDLLCLLASGALFGSMELRADNNNQ